MVATTAFSARSGWSISRGIRWSVSRGIGGQFAPESGGQYQRILQAIPVLIVFAMALDASREPPAIATLDFNRSRRFITSILKINVVVVQLEGYQFSFLPAL